MADTPPRRRWRCATSKLAERSAEMGRYLMDGLRTLMHHPWVGDIRGKGLLAGVELVQSRDTKEPVGTRQIQAVVDFCRDDGLIVGRSGGGQRYSNTITLAPPLVITRGEIDRIVETLNRAIAVIPAAMA